MIGVSELKARLQSDMKSAMKAGEKDRLGVIRLMMASVKQREVDERIELEDDQIIAVLDRMVKQRRESITQFDSAGRDDLSAIEKAEVLVIQDYLPKALSDEEITAMVESAIAETGAEGVSG
ncbi:MAG: GatB/YqeY domain-containing protein, partial [Gammaproteobacteria bacterium]|nr:GatB/YqeY domain-containing protein [Gammaproteobacteria bacterium]